MSFAVYVTTVDMIYLGSDVGMTTVFFDAMRFDFSLSYIAANIDACRLRVFLLLQHIIHVIYSDIFTAILFDLAIDQRLRCRQLLPIVNKVSNDECSVTIVLCFIII